MGDRFLRYFNNPGQLIINVSWQVAGRVGEGGPLFLPPFQKWHQHFKAFALPRGEPFTKDLISDSNRPAQLR